MYQHFTEATFIFFDEKFSKSFEFYYLEPGLYASITVMVEAMNTLIQKRHNHSGSCIAVKVSRRKQKVEIYLPKEKSGIACFSVDLGQFFGCNVGNESGVVLRGKGLHKPEFAYDFVRIYSLMIYMDLVEYNMVDDTEGPLLRCFFFISELKRWDI